PGMDDDSDLVPRHDDGRSHPWLVYGGIAGAILTVMAFLGFTEIGMVIIFTVGSSLYSKLSKKDILNHEVRGLIRGYIIANPGDHYSSIKRNLDLNNGTLAYHLRVLEQSGFIKSMYDGIYKRYYPSNVNISKLKKNVSKQEEIFNIILENPGVTMEEIGRMIGVSRQVVNYHVKNLIRAGVVSYLRDQKSAKFFPRDDGGKGFEQT
ncbi:MAG: winged helix-turn-helix transcriptional regulator, partial [Candidatus Thermoplasmatota archaeon]|nr:winged helix-turn-helix transcriptional regulator [Candidatus Thermoplasmatota archaeon]